MSNQVVHWSTQCELGEMQMTAHNKKAFQLLDYCRQNVCTPDGKRICILCGHHSVQGEKAVLGIFVANQEHQKRLGAPAGKDRLIIYVLCEECHIRPDRNERVEEKIVATVRVQ